MRRILLALGAVAILVGLFVPLKPDFSRVLIGFGVGIVIALAILSLILLRKDWKMAYEIQQHDERSLQIRGLAALITWHITQVLLALLGLYLYFTVSKTAGSLVLILFALHFVVQLVGQIILSKKL